MGEIDELVKLIGAIRERTTDRTARKQLDELEKRLQAFTTKGAPDELSRVEPVDLARSFRGVIEQIQEEAREAEVAGVTIKSMDLEVKGLVEAAPDATRLVLPSAAAEVDPNALSTLRVSFGVIPSLQAENEPEDTRRSSSARRRGTSSR